MDCDCKICHDCMCQTIDVKYLDVIDRFICPSRCKEYTIDSIQIDGLNDVLLRKYLKNNPSIRGCPRSDCQYWGTIQDGCKNYECVCGILWKMGGEDNLSSKI